MAPVPRLSAAAWLWLGFASLALGCSFQPSASTLIDRGDELAVEGKFPAAIAAYSQAIQLDPKNAQTYFDRGLAYEQSLMYAEALADFRQCLKLDEEHPYAHNSLAWILCTCQDAALRDGQKALEHAKRSRQLETESIFDDTLAAAYAELGQFDEAVKIQQMAVDSAVEEELEDEELIGMRARLKLFKEKKPYRE